MKKIVSALLLLAPVVTAADAAPSYIRPDNLGGYNVTYNYTDKPKNDWYMTFRAELGLLNFKNTYYSDDVGYNGYDKYSMEPVFGGSVAIGKKFGYWWRGEIEAGYTGNFKDSGEGLTFNFSAPYVLANAIYDFSSGLYLGGGVGVAVPMQSWDWDGFVVGPRRKTSLGAMGALMFGYAHKLDDNFVLDLRYRLAGFSGNKFAADYQIQNSAGAVIGQFEFENKIGLVLDNSLSVALRYEF